MSRSMTDAFGRETVDALAAWAIDALCYPPARIETASTRVSASEIRRGRAILDEAGIDWRALKGDARSERAARASRTDETPPH